MTFEVADAARLDVRTPFDLIFVFDAVHDQVDPQAVLRASTRALARWRLLHEGATRRGLPRGQHRQPDGAVALRMSTLHCMTVSLAHGGAGIGTVFAEKLALELLAEAGFTSVEMQVAPGDPADAVYLARR